LAYLQLDLVLLQPNLGERAGQKLVAVVIDAHGDLDKLGSESAGQTFAIYAEEWEGVEGFGFEFG